MAPKILGERRAFCPLDAVGGEEKRCGKMLWVKIFCHFHAHSAGKKPAARLHFPWVKPRATMLSASLKRRAAGFLPAECGWRRGKTMRENALGENLLPFPRTFSGQNARRSPSFSVGETPCDDAFRVVKKASGGLFAR